MRNALSVLLFLGCLPAYSQSPLILTNGFLNCRTWIAAPSDARVLYLFGFAEGSNLVGERLPSWWPSGSNYGEIAEGVTKICSEPENARIQVNMAIHIFAEKVKGTPEEYIQKSLEMFRKFAADHPDEK